MRTRYANRIVIFDLPPVLLSDDALAFARHLQAGLLVIGEGQTRREDVDAHARAAARPEVRRHGAQRLARAVPHLYD